VGSSFDGGVNGHDAVLDARAEGRYVPPRSRPSRPYGAQTSKAMNAELRGAAHPQRLRAVQGISRLVERELDRLEALPDDEQKLALMCVLEMMLSDRQTVAQRGREAYLRLKGLLLSKGDEKKMRKANGLDANAGLM
jgi:hypothetical protein